MDIGTVVKECQDGSSEAFGILYQAYSLPMLGVIDYYVHNHDIAQDILHDGFIVAFTSIASLKDATKVESWLTTIMKNLSLQYLRKEAEHISIPMSDTSIPEQLAEEREQSDLTWEQLELIIQRLPEGYGKVFRLNVLQGLSHKEIAKLLGISHLTSASQLHHAKVMLRRMINQYRMEMGILSIIAITVFVYHSIIQNHNQVKSFHSDDDNPLLSNLITVDSLTNNTDSITNGRNMPIVSPVQKRICKSLIKKIEHGELETDTINVVLNDSININTDSIIGLPPNPNTEIFIAGNTQDKPIISSPKDKWAFSISYSGAIGQANNSHYRVPDISSGIPGDDMEEKQSIRHYMPITLGVSVGKSFSSQWGVESGVRYTFLRTDVFNENKYSRSEKVYRIHYIGIPLKVNYKVFQTNKISIYGQTGFVLDVPIHGSSKVSEYYPNVSSPTINKYNLNMPLQWSVEGGIGIQYQFTLSIGVYAEPSFKYYFKSGSEINTIRQDKPFEFTIPIGVKFTW